MVRFPKKPHKDWIGEPYTESKTMLATELWQDGKFHSTYPDANAAFAGLLHVQPFSTAYATLWGGWAYKYIYSEEQKWVTT